MNKMNALVRFIIVVILIFLLPDISKGQTEKQVTEHTHLWLSMNATYRFSKRWGMIADFHNRTEFAFKDPRFYFGRLGVNYWIQNKMFVGAGYGHLWSSPVAGGSTWVNENRIHEQFQFTTGSGKTQITQRLRNEQRWIEKIRNDVRTGDTKFVDRVRYLLSVNVQVFKKPTLPSLVFADELMLNFGKEVVYNTMDQNRLFIGIKQNMNKHLSFDFGYMNVYQQRPTGYQYDMNHTIRLFFYYTGGWKADKSTGLTPHHHEE